MQGLPERRAWRETKVDQEAPGLKVQQAQAQLERLSGA